MASSSGWALRTVGLTPGNVVISRSMVVWSLVEGPKASSIILCLG